MASEHAVPVADSPIPEAVPHLSEGESRAKGKEARTKVPRRSQADYAPPADRPDPVALLQG